MRPSLEVTRQGTLSRGYKRIEFAVDFERAAQESLDRKHLEIFRQHFLCRKPWHRCAANRGQFFHAVYRIEKLVGRAVCDRDMFPTSRYFASWPIDAGQLAPLRGGLAPVRKAI